MHGIGTLQHSPYARLQLARNCQGYTLTPAEADCSPLLEASWRSQAINRPAGDQKPSVTECTNLLPSGLDAGLIFQALVWRIRIPRDWVQVLLESLPGSTFVLLRDEVKTPLMAALPLTLVMAWRHAEVRSRLVALEQRSEESRGNAEARLP